MCAKNSLCVSRWIKVKCNFPELFPMLAAFLTHITIVFCSYHSRQSEQFLLKRNQQEDHFADSTPFVCVWVAAFVPGKIYYAERTFYHPHQDSYITIEMLWASRYGSGSKRRRKTCSYCIIAEWASQFSTHLFALFREINNLERRGNELKTKFLLFSAKFSTMRGGPT